MKIRPVALVLWSIAYSGIYLVCFVFLNDLWIALIASWPIMIGFIWNTRVINNRNDRIGYCENCGYELRGIKTDKSRQCPECGQGIGWSQRTIELYHAVKDQEDHDGD